MSPTLVMAPAFGQPAAVTSPASVVLPTSATLNAVVGDGGQINAGGGTSTWLFQWGTDSTFASYSSTTATNFSGTGVVVSVNLTGLTASTRYFGRAVVTNEAGTTTGLVSSFETTLNVPTLVAPSDGTTAVALGMTFAWIYNSGGASGGQTGYSLKLTGTVPGHSGTGPWYWTGSGWSSTQTWIASSAQSVTIGPAYFLPNAGSWLAGNTYTWTVATQDANGNGAFA